MVELLADVVGELEVLALVVAHRHARGAVGGDVGSHQVGIHVEAGRRGFAVAAGLVLELRHPVQPAQARDAVENPAQADVRGDGGLREQGATGRVYAAGEQGGGHLQRLRAQPGRVLEAGDGVQVHDAEQALVGVLQGDPLAYGAQVVADGGDAGGLNAGEDAVHGACMAWKREKRKEGLLL